MSADALPISAPRFAAALKDLSLPSLHAKVAELRNSIAHLQKSNLELEEFVRQEDDRDCYEALLENREVIKRMEERIELVRVEVVEVRAMPWVEEEKEKKEAVGDTDARTSTSASVGDGAGVNGDVNGTAQGQPREQQGQNGSGTVAASTAENADATEREEGVFL
ncbi:hypothetical protein BS50DRAFT_171596 [Corynespora cassiicola Philippines]|uniref:Uncharacterized protein n=1 Tax=Corynespora cassiicola Philippines TaxID=1448308 RepID=A0A2T2P567_CORCC|nr:hypothetical protein BS50DRAFT_171596 [Corynespora cassiicola Philippines]